MWRLPDTDLTQAYFQTYAALFDYYVDETKLMIDLNHTTNYTDDLAIGSNCGKDLFVARVQVANLAPEVEYCPTTLELDKTLLHDLMFYSDTHADPTNPNSMVQTVKSANAMGFEPIAFVTSPDNANAGVAASTPTECDKKIQIQGSTWVRFYSERATKCRGVYVHVTLLFLSSHSRKMARSSRVMVCICSLVL